MKTELQKQLLEKYSVFFQTDKKIHIGEQPLNEVMEELTAQKEIVEPIQFGISCGDGWYWLLDNLMDSILHYCRNNKKPLINILQIKEKFGGLRFYFNGGDDIIHGMVWFAEHLSYHVCEYCGTTENVGHTRGWMATMCKDCHEKNERLKHLEWVEYK